MKKTEIIWILLFDQFFLVNGTLNLSSKEVLNIYLISMVCHCNVSTICIPEATITVRPEKGVIISIICVHCSCKIRKALRYRNSDVEAYMW